MTEDKKQSYSQTAHLSKSVDDLIANPFRDANLANPPLKNITNTNDETSIEQTIYQQLSKDRQDQAKALSEKIDASDSQSIVSYGAMAQKEIGDFSHQIIAQVQNQDLDVVGEQLRALLSRLNDTDPSQLANQNQSRIQRWFKKQKASLYEMNAKYQKVGYQIDEIASQLNRQKNGLLNDNLQLESLYQQNLEFFEALNVYIAAAQIKADRLRQEELPSLKNQITSDHDQMTIQKIADLEQFINRLEKRIYDLELTREITIQQAPQIRLIQNANQNLAEKIQSSIYTAIPLWKNQIAIQLSLYRQKDALDAQIAVTDTTNQLLTENAELLKQSSLETARQSERGVVDIDTLKHSQQKLIDTITETMQIQEEGRAKRLQAEREMVQMESELKQHLLNSSSKKS
ncbi:toxic anion resistance protein [Aerococcus urinaeequi]|uniref:Toxic anion resistance protein n=1 Tax=Aerococcus viridans TaxID=1377 RepID=A0A2N6UF28_9LACT|nr:MULTISPECIES: toxic anion resistance protein [Aerococcus]OFU51313.1 tellurite resistance protein TelA [Aerococcus sp. HMSC10H05]PMC80160.1 toxic anion resistance protein [Aerococcus viridans]